MFQVHIITQAFRNLLGLQHIKKNHPGLEGGGEGASIINRFQGMVRAIEGDEQLVDYP